jgi:diacylglycerol diphosphate phosphatase/phosphatidate phosphatase
MFDCLQFFKKYQNEIINTIFLILIIIYSVYLQSNDLIIRDYQFREQDPKLSFPLKDSQVSTVMLALLSWLVPIGIIIYVMIMMICFDLTKIKNNKSFAYFRTVILALIFTLLFTSAVTNSIKVSVGYPRPNCFAKCDYQYFNTNNTEYLSLTKFNQIGSKDLCYSNTNDISDAFQSFPSGHSSLIFSAITFASNVISDGIGGTDGTNETTTQNAYIGMCNMFIHVGLYALAIWVGVTRIQDYYHNTFDVIAGLILGCVIAHAFTQFMKMELKRLNLYKKCKDENNDLHNELVVQYQDQC